MGEYSGMVISVSFIKLIKLLIYIFVTHRSKDIVHNSTIHAMKWNGRGAQHRDAQSSIYILCKKKKKKE